MLRVITTISSIYQPRRLQKVKTTSPVDLKTWKSKKKNKKSH